MPNHVVNHLNFVGESTRIKELLNTIKNEALVLVLLILIK